MLPVRWARQLGRRWQGSLPGRVLAGFGRDRGSDWAAIIAFNVLFSLFPMLGALLTILGLLALDPATLGQIRAWLLLVVPDPVADQVAMGLRSTGQSAGLVGSLSLVGLLWGASGLFQTTARALNAVFGLPERSFVRQTVLSIGMIAVVAVLLLVTLSVTTATQLALAFLDRWIPAPPVFFRLLVFLAGHAVALSSAFLLFLTLLWLLPNRRFSFRQVWPGALLSAVGLLLLVQLFPLYLRLTTGFAEYGRVFGLFLLVMLWFSLVGQIVLLGAELNATLLGRYHEVLDGFGGHPQTPARQGTALPGPSRTQGRPSATYLAARRPEPGGRLPGFGALAALALAALVLLRRWRSG